MYRDIGCGSLRFLVDGDDTGGAFAMVEGEECGRVTALHRHLHMDETFYVLDGTLTVYVDGQIRKLPAGSSITIPKGTPHAQGAPGDARVRVLTTFVPAGFEGALRERAEIVASGINDPMELQRRLDDIRTRYDIERLGESPIPAPGPPPDSQPNGAESDAEAVR